MITLKMRGPAHGNERTRCKGKQTKPQKKKKKKNQENFWNV